jgi:hypothetical protein
MASRLPRSSTSRAPKHPRASKDYRYRCRAAGIDLATQLAARAIYGARFAPPTGPHILRRWRSPDIKRRLVRLLRQWTRCSCRVLAVTPARNPGRAQAMRLPTTPALLQRPGRIVWFKRPRRSTVELLACYEARHRRDMALLLIRSGDCGALDGRRQALSTRRGPIGQSAIPAPPAPRRNLA